MNSAFVLVLTLVAAAPNPSDSSPAKPDFVTVFQRNFDAWDKDDNGLLTPAEVDGAIADAKLSGEDAAAAATLKCVSRDNLYRIRRLDVATIKDDQA